MKIEKIRIKNFRSIKDETILLDQNCKILLGKNESGKSNVLKAIAAVFGGYEVAHGDRRKRIDNEKITEYCVEAIFKLSESDYRIILKEIEKYFDNTKHSELKEYIKSVFTYFILGKNIKSNECYTAYFIPSELKKEKCKSLEEKRIISKTPENFSLNDTILEQIEIIYEENKIKCNYWQYKKDFLLPSDVYIQTFIDNPESQKALKNIFTLCNREDIKKEFLSAKNEDGDYSNLLKQISDETTKIFRKIWKDSDKTSIELISDGQKIRIKVVDKVKYSFGDRSDGFKKFISILLMLSTRHRSNLLDNNDIILIDEPDQSLYPTSARHLKEELLKIAKDSFVIYSTHSEYMIDSHSIERHYIVEKKDDITTLSKQSKNAPFSEDELLRRAIGSSIFACLKPINLIFEGWLDQKLFEKYCEFNKIKNFLDYGRVYLGGISGVKTLIQLLILASKKFVIITDSDQASNSKKKDFEKEYPNFKKNWLSYNVNTMEDFFEDSYIESTIITSGVDNFKYNSEKNAIDNIKNAVSNEKDKIQEIKNKLIDSFSKNDIKKEYSAFIKKITTETKNLVNA